MIIEYVDGDESRIKWSHGGGWKSADLVDLIDAYEAERIKHGRWEVGYAEYGVVVHRCSLCGHAIATHEDSNYCPKCGADMREVEE